MVKSLFSILLSFQVLVGSAGIPVFLHTCHLFGETDISLGEPISCCGDDYTSQETVDFQCCSQHELSFEVDVETDLSKTFKVNPETFTTNSVLDVQHTGISNESTNWHQANGPPPLTEKERLNLIQVYRL